MKTPLEKSLNSLQAPTTPHTLKERCMNTIPSHAIDAAPRTNVTFQRKARPFLLPRVAVAGVLMFSVAAGAAFWSTRPSGEGISQHSGGALFAQVLEAAQQVTFCHAKGRQIIFDHTYSKTPGNPRWFRDEIWFDMGKGFYSQSTQDGSVRSRGDIDGPVPGGTLYDRSLILSDGRIFNRVGMSSTVYAAVDTRSWEAQRKNLTGLLTANVAGTSDLSGARFGQVLSSTKGSWKGQAAQVLMLERQLAPREASRAPGPVQAHLYVSPVTKRLIAYQEFAVLEGVAPQLIAECEIDYSRPDTAIFDPKSIQEGAQVRSFPGSSTQKPQPTPREDEK